MHLGGARGDEHGDELLHRVAAHNRVVDDHDSLAGDLVQRVEFQLDPLPSQLLVGLDEGAAHVAVLDQAFLVGNPRRLGKPDRRRRTGVGDRHHEICNGGRFFRESLAHAHPARVDLAATEARVGPGEVDVLEDAGRTAPCGERLGAVDPCLVKPENLAGTHVAVDGGADQVERAALGGDDPVIADAPEREGPDAVRVAERDEGVVDERDHRVGALETTHRGGHRLGQRSGVAGDQGCDHLGVGRRPEPNTVCDEFLAENARVRQIAVVAEGDGARPPVMDERLGVRPVHAPGRRIAGVADRDLAGKRLQLLFVEDLGDEPHVAEHRQAATLRDRDPCRFLAPVLQGEEREVREPRDVTVDRTDAEDATHG